MSGSESTAAIGVLTDDDIRRLGVTVPSWTSPQQTEIRNTKTFCIACSKNFKDGQRIKLFSCGHRVHADDSCLGRIVPCRCPFLCKPDEIIDPGTLRDHYWDRSNPPEFLQQSRPSNLPLFLPESQAPVLDLDSHSNLAVKMAEGHGYATIRPNANIFPSFHCDEARIPMLMPRKQVSATIQHRKALIAPSAEVFLQQRKRGFINDADLLFEDWVNSTRPCGRPDIERFKDLGGPDLPKALWMVFVQRRNWWFISYLLICDRTFARSSLECHWIHLMDGDIRKMHRANPPRFQAIAGMNRWWNGFKFHIDFAKEVIYRLDSKRWISADDVTWRFFKTYERREKEFPLISKDVLDLEIPPALGIPTPPTPFYYGKLMSILQRTRSDDELLAILEHATYLETLILLLSRFHSEMRFAGRLHLISEKAIVALRKNASNYDLGLDVSTADLIAAMEKARKLWSDEPGRFNKVEFRPPYWANVGISGKVQSSWFVWSLLPFPELDRNALGGQTIVQFLENGTTKVALHITDRLGTGDYSPRFRRLVHKEELNGIPHLEKFATDEFGKNKLTYQVGALLERATVRIQEKRNHPQPCN